MFSEFFEKIFRRERDNSRSEVKQRLQLLLAHDRADITPQILEKIRREIIEVVSKYVEIDDEGLEFMLESDQRLSALVVNFPIRRIRSDEEERKPVETTQAAIILDEDGGAAAEAEAEAAEAAAAAEDKGENKDQDRNKQDQNKDKKPAQKPMPDDPNEVRDEGPPPEVEIALDDDLPSHMQLELEAGLGSAPASEQAPQ